MISPCAVGSAVPLQPDNLLPLVMSKNGCCFVRKSNPRLSGCAACGDRISLGLIDVLARCQF